MTFLQHVGWDTRPTWIDPSEWRFLLCSYRALQPTDRLALFLLLYGGLNIRQVNRLLFSLPSDGRGCPQTPAQGANSSPGPG
jgi:hypothetical protein